jgi:hypothetical protein
MVMKSSEPSMADLARAKQESGEKSREDLRRENGYFAFPDARLDLAHAKLS